MNVDRNQKRRKQFKIESIILLTSSILIGLHIGYSVSTLSKHSATEETPTILTYMIDGLEHLLSKPWQIYPSRIEPIITCFLIAVLLWSYMYSHYLEMMKTMPGEEAGTAEFETNYSKFNKNFLYDPAICKQIKPRKKTYRNPESNIVYCKYNIFSKKEKNACKTNSIILSNDVYLSLNNRFTRRNVNTAIIGGSSAGKSRFSVKPNILQGHTSYITTDPSGEIMTDTAPFLEKEGYIIKCLNIEDMTASNRYNSFQYIRTAKDIPIMINCLLKNTDNGNTGGDPFWPKAETALHTACCAFLWEARPIKERNFTNVMEMLRLVSNAQEEEASEKEDELDKIFYSWEKKYPKSYAVKNYKTFKMAPTKTKLSILLTAAVRLGTYFDLDEVSNLTCIDEMELDQVGFRKTAIFIVTPQGDTTYSFIVSMLYTQLYDTLYKAGEKQGRETGNYELPMKVRSLNDEFYNTGKIPDFETKLGTMRKYGISANIYLQGLSQLKKMYKDEWEIILENCDVLVFMGGNGKTTLDYISDRLGKQTISNRNITLNKGSKQGGASINKNNTGRELMMSTEIAEMDNNKCLVFIRGCKPFFTNKYKYENHPNYKYTKDANPEIIYKTKFYIDKEIDDCSLYSDKSYISPNDSIENTEKIDQIKDQTNEVKEEISELDNFQTETNSNTLISKNINIDKNSKYTITGAYYPKYEFILDEDFPYVPSVLEENIDDEEEKLIERITENPKEKQDTMWDEKSENNVSNGIEEPTFDDFNLDSLFVDYTEND